MSVIDQLERRIEEVSRLLSERELASYEVNPARELSVISLRNHLDELRESLRREKALRYKEVIELRLSGDVARDGSIPLNLLGEVAENLAKSLQSSARYFKKGTQGGAIPQDIVNTMDLRLVGIASGSTRLIVTGNTAPDLFGYSLLEESLEGAFELLGAADSDELTVNVAKVGAASAGSVRKLLNALATSNVTANLSWTNPSEVQRQWEGTPEKMLQLAQSLEGFEPVEEARISIIGEIVTLSLKEKFEIRTEGDESYQAEVPTDLMELIKTLHVGQRVQAAIEKNTIVNRITGTERTRYKLVSVEPF